jgi:acyl-coenzyme A thioesterase PaaI-like protein
MAFSLERFKQTFGMRLFGWLKIPLLASVRPSVVELSETRCVVRIPLRRWTRNHLGSMYFGALAIGADCAGGLLAMDAIRRSGGGVSLVFKAFQASFLKRPESDVYFICEEGAAIRDQVRRALETSERITEPMHMQAATRTPDGGFEPVAEFTLELSLKRTS